MTTTPQVHQSPLFTLLSPLTSRMVGFLSIPHSGEDIPADFTPYLTGDTAAYQEDVDFQVHELVDLTALRQRGIGILYSHVHRVAVDLNRSPDKAVLHWEKNTKGKVIRKGQLPPEEETRLREKYYAPYYEVLKAAIQELEAIYQETQRVPLIDLHSMPSRPTEYHLKINPHQKAERPDFCLSDLRGKSCSPEYIQYAHELFREQGYNPAINDPYFGGYLTEYMHHYHSQVIQIEIKRGLYMDEERKVLVPEKVEQLRPRLTEVLIRNYERFGIRP